MTDGGNGHGTGGIGGAIGDLGCRVLDVLDTSVTVFGRGPDGSLQPVWANARREGLLSPLQGGDWRGDLPDVEVLVRGAIEEAWREGRAHLDVDVAARLGRRAFTVELTRIEHAGEPLVVVQTTESTELRQAERDRQLAIEHLITTDDLVRREIAAELHDDAIQTLIAAALDLQVYDARGRGDADAGHTVDLDEVQATLRELIDRLRDLVFDLYPTTLATVGLGAVLEERFGRRAESAGVSMRVHDVAGDIPTPAREVLYRVAAEAIRNALRHAHAEHLVVEIERAPQAYLLTIDDDGRGIEPGGAASGVPGHVGLGVMRTTIERAGGEVELSRRESGGTRVSVVLPRDAVARHALHLDDAARLLRDAIDQMDSDLQMVWSSSPEGLMTSRPDGIIQRLNPAAARILGERVEDVIGSHALAWLPPEDLERLTELGSGVLSDEGPDRFAVVTAAVRRDGTRLPVLLQVRALRTPTGDVVGTVATLTDATRVLLPGEPETNPEGLALYRAVRDEGGSVADLRCTHASVDAHHRGTPVVGSTLVATRPVSVNDGFLRLCIGALESGTTASSTLFHHPLDGGSDLFDVHVVPLSDDDVAICWRTIVGSLEPPAPRRPTLP